MRYAIVKDGVVVNVTICSDPEFATSQGWVPLDDDYWIGDFWSVDSGFSHPDVAVI